jgi:two-component system, sensor histidine kinase YesM
MTVMRGFRPGIRVKLLSISILAIVLVVSLELLAHAAASSSGREFEFRLGQYHAIHRLRMALSEFRTAAERFINENDRSLLPALEGRAKALASLAEGVEAFGSDSMDARFEARAARRGIEAYLPMAETAIGMRKESRPGYYARFTEAERIAFYADGYLSKLLSLSMEAGQENARAVAARALAVRRFALAGVLAAGLVSLLFSVLFASSISASIRRLAKAARTMASGKLEVDPVIAKTGDEIEVLADGFNAMSANIRSLVEGLKEKAGLEKRLHEEELSLVSMGRALREAQLMNLQDQVRPHFLFNALNAISRQARLEGAPASEGMARSLGRLLRYAIASEGAFAPLDEELGVVSEYLAFQKIRFGERLTWKVDVDPGAGAVLLPRFTLQPVVENAVRHGIEPKVGGGIVRVSARRAGGRVKIKIWDSGVGMERGAAAALLSPADGGIQERRASVDGGGAGIGLANLRSRLAYRYGENAAMRVSSRPGKGTIVSISVPDGAA